jgi:tetratricopeptide (TPR) repeat protein
MPERLLVDLLGEGVATVSTWPDGGSPEEVSRGPARWPLDGDALEDLRWYLEEYRTAPYAAWAERGPATAEKLPAWGSQVFDAVFGGGQARSAYQRAREQRLELVFRSAEPRLLALPWELMRDASGPVALGTGGISRSLRGADDAETLTLPGGKLRVLMVTAPPEGTEDAGYQTAARPLLERLAAVRGEVELTVLRPPAVEVLRATVQEAAEAGQPFHVVHVDARRSATDNGAGAGLAFESLDGGREPVSAATVAEVLAGARVPVVVVSAVQPGAVGTELAASLAAVLLNGGCAAVVAMACTVYSVAAAEFMAVFYDSVLAGQSVSQAVTAGRKRLFEHGLRPGPQGDLPLADWLVPVHYRRRDVRLADARPGRPSALDEALDQARVAPTSGIEGAEEAAPDPLAAAHGVFAGRDDAFHQLEAAARGPRVVLLTGPTGTGKTELAKGFARWWRDSGGVSDPGLVLWQSFEPGIASFALDAVVNEIGAAALGAGFGRLDQGQRLAAVKRLLAESRALLVWDNFESVAERPDPAGATPALDEDEQAELREFLAWVRDHSASTVVITSQARESWLGDVHRIVVGGLSRAEAAEYAGLLLAPYPAARRRLAERAAAELLEWLDGHPLSMLLTLPRLDDTDPAWLLDGLRGTAALPADADDDREQRTPLSACLAYSFTHLDAGTRQLLPAVGLFHGVTAAHLLATISVIPDAPGRFASANPVEWTTALADAAGAGLLTELEPGMFAMHPALPGFLAAAWRDDDPAGYDQQRVAAEQVLREVCARFGQWLADQAATGDAEEAEYAEFLTGWQRRTLGAMLGQALDRRAWDDARRIVAALEAYWQARRLDGEATAWADRILAVTTDSVPGQPAPGAESLWLFTSSRAADRLRRAGRLEQAAEDSQRILDWLLGQPATEWTRGHLATAHHQLGLVAQYRDRLEEADTWFRQALTRHEEVGNRAGMATTCNDLGTNESFRRRFDEADTWYGRAHVHEAALSSPSRTLTTHAYHNLGRTAQVRGAYEEAAIWYRRAFTLHEEAGHRPGMAAACRELASSTSKWDDEADTWYRRLLTLQEELGHRADMASTYRELGQTAQARGRDDEADTWHRQALASHEESGDRAGMAASYNDLGLTAQRRGRLDEADTWHRQALALQEELGPRWAVAASCRDLGQTAQRRGRLDEAESWFRRYLAIGGDQYHLALAYHQLQQLAEERGEARQALTWNIRNVTLKQEFPGQVTRSSLEALVRLTRQLGLPALEAAWREASGQPVPQAVLDYVADHRDDQAEPPSGS